MCVTGCPTSRACAGAHGSSPQGGGGCHHRTQQPERHPKGCTCSPRSASAHRPRHPLQGGGCVSHELSPGLPGCSTRAGRRLRGACRAAGAAEGYLARGKGWKEGGGSTDRLEEARGAGWYQRYLSCANGSGPLLHLRASSCGLMLPARPVRGLLGARTGHRGAQVIIKHPCPCTPLERQHGVEVTGADQPWAPRL